MSPCRGQQSPFNPAPVIERDRFDRPYRTLKTEGCSKSCRLTTSVWHDIDDDCSIIESFLREIIVKRCVLKVSPNPNVWNVIPRFAAFRNSSFNNSLCIFGSSAGLSCRYTLPFLRYPYGHGYKRAGVRIRGVTTSVSNVSLACDGLRSVELKREF